MNDERAIIDIGSNTVRLVIFGGPQRAPVVLHNEKVTARLGKGVADSGLLTAKAMQTALTALARFAMLLDVRDVRQVETVATAAVRDAANGREFLDSVRALGLTVRLLTGEEEALTSAAGIIGAFPAAKGVVADLGGGSLELVHVAGAYSEQGASLPFGTLWLPQLRATGSASFARHIRKALVATEWHCTEGEALYLVGGSHRALARLAMHQLDWPLGDSHGFELTPDAVQHVCRSALRGGVPNAIPGLSNSRLGALPDVAALLLVLIREIRPSRVVFSAWGLREGLLYSSLSKTEQALDPMLVGVSAFVELLGSPLRNADAVVNWTSAARPDGPDGYERLRLASTALVVTAQRFEPNLRHSHALDWALQKRWIGICDSERAMIAACIVGNSGRADWPLGIDRLATKAQLDAGFLWGLAIRLCRRFSGLAPAALAASNLGVEHGKLCLTVHESIAALLNEGTQKDLRNLADALGLEPCLQFR